MFTSLNAISSNHGIFYDLPLGKLDGNKRVLRSGAQGSCYLVATQQLRERSSFRGFEKEVDDFQSKIEESYKSLPRILPTLLYYSRDWNYNKEDIQKLAEKEHFLLSRPELLEREFKQKSNGLTREQFIHDLEEKQDLMRAFLKQSTFSQFSDFIRDVFSRQMGTTYLSLIYRLNISPDLVQEKFQKRFSIKFPELQAKEDFKQHPAYLWDGAVKGLLEKTISTLYGIKKLDWPLTSVDKVISVLKTHGPFVVSGNIGFFVYETDPFMLREKIGDRNVYGWPPNSKKREGEHISHIVTVMGAAKHPVDLGKGYVYFLDPNDPSDPAHPELERIFKISHATFVKLAECGEYLSCGERDIETLRKNMSELLWGK